MWAVSSSGSSRSHRSAATTAKFQSGYYPNPLKSLILISRLCIEREENDISILGSYWVVDSSLFCQKLTLHGKILAGNKTKKNQNFSEILEKVEGEGHLFPWRTIYIMYVIKTNKSFFFPKCSTCKYIFGHQLIDRSTLIDSV